MRWFGWLRRDKARDEAAMAQAKVDALTMAGGRSHSAGIPYAMPNDLEEMNRLDFQHFVFRQTLRGNYAAPISNPTSILDVGTGTGRWAREVAQVFPGADVVGLDVNEPPADEAATSGRVAELLPPNYRFVAGNVLEGLPFADATFDFTHIRLMVAAIPHDRWPFVIGELVRVTRPGGWVESVETTGVPEAGGPAMEQINLWGKPVLARRGIEVSDGARVGELLTQAGLGNITAYQLALPFGANGGRVGKMLATDYFTGAKAFGGLIAAQGVATAEQVARVLDDAQAEVNSPAYKGSAPLYIAYGQRVR